jgi:AraC family ethanolamine operon transcriptional activator
MSLKAPAARDRARPNRSREDVVECAESYVRAHPATPTSMATLCRVVGRSERGLRKAFYDVRGMSPKRCLLAERLRGVRQALSNDGVGAISVTGVATAYGFYELGRFAGIYKREFGEAPSETLRAASRKLPRRPRLNT